MCALLTIAKTTENPSPSKRLIQEISKNNKGYFKDDPCKHRDLVDEAHILFSKAIPYYQKPAKEFLETRIDFELRFTNHTESLLYQLLWRAIKEDPNIITLPELYVEGEAYESLKKVNIIAMISNINNAWGSLGSIACIQYKDFCMFNFQFIY